MPGLPTVAPFQAWRGSAVEHCAAPGHQHQGGTYGEGGIRTLGTRIEYTRVPGVHLKPLGHLSKKTKTAFRL